MKQHNHSGGGRHPAGLTASFRRILNAYRVELLKAFHRKFSYAGPLLILIVVAATLRVHPMIRDGAGDYSFIAYATPMALNLLGFLILLVYCAALVSSELGSGTICLILVRPLRRFEFVLAKLLLAMTYAVLLAATAALSSWLAVLALGDLGGVTYGGEVMYTGMEMIEIYLIGAALALLPLFAAAAYAVMISCLTRSTGAAIGSAVGIWIVADIVKHPLGVAPFLFSTYLETPWQVFVGRCDGLDPQWFPGAVYVIASSLVSLIVFTAVAILALSRRNLHT